MSSDYCEPKPEANRPTEIPFYIKIDTPEVTRRANAILGLEILKCLDKVMPSLFFDGNVGAEHVKALAIEKLKSKDFGSQIEAKIRRYVNETALKIIRDRMPAIMEEQFSTMTVKEFLEATNYGGYGSEQVSEVDAGGASESSD